MRVLGNQERRFPALQWPLNSRSLHFARNIARNHIIRIPLYSVRERHGVSNGDACVFGKQTSSGLTIFCVVVWEVNHIFCVRYSRDFSQLAPRTQDHRDLAKHVLSADAFQHHWVMNFLGFWFILLNGVRHMEQQHYNQASVNIDTSRVFISVCVCILNNVSLQLHLHMMIWSKITKSIHLAGGITKIVCGVYAHAYGELVHPTSPRWIVISSVIV